MTIEEINKLAEKSKREYDALTVLMSEIYEQIETEKQKEFYNNDKSYFLGEFHIIIQLLLMGLANIDPKIDDNEITLLRFLAHQQFSLEEYLDFDFTIPQFTEVESKDGLFIFQTTESKTIKSGELYVDIEAVCETPGSSSNNYKTGTINNLITPLSYIENIKNITITSGGADDEDADALRDRIRQAPEKFSNAGSKGAYIYHTLSAHQSIIDVEVTSPSPGIVNVFPLTENGCPSDEIIKIVQKHLNSEKIRPLTDFVQVIPPESIVFSISATLILYSYADIETVNKTITSKLNEYKVALSEKLGKDVVHTQIITILNSIYGVYKVILNTPNDIEIKENQWAELTSYDIKFGGYIDE